MFARIYSNLPIILILLIASVLRFLYLDRIPGAITGDELNYLWVIRFVVLTGSDITGGWNPLSVLVFSYPTAFSQAELPYFLLYPFVNIFGFSLLSTRFLYAAMSVGSVFAMYLVVRYLFNSRTALIAAALTAINPWQIFIGRTTYEMVPASFFYLLGIYFLLRAKGGYILLSFPIFLLAFYSYIGTKVAFVPVIMIVTLFAWILNKRKYTKYYLLINLLAIFFVGFFAYSLFSQGGGRSSELFTPFSSQVSEQVDVFRRDSLAPEFVNTIFENKFIVYARIVFSKILNVFSPDYLFFQADNFVSLIRHGLFYYLDAVFLFVGCAFLFFKKRRLFIFVAALVFAGLIPEVLYKDRVDIFSPHLALFLTFLLIPVAVGIDYIIGLDKKRLFSKAAVFIYAVLVFNFSYLYFFQFPVVGHFDFSMRILSKYISYDSKENITVFIKTPEDAFKKHIYYENLLNKESVSKITETLNSGDFSIKNITFKECGEIGESIDEHGLSIYNTALCESPESALPYLKISLITDSGEKFRIYNDTVCGEYDLNSYISDLDIADFDMEDIAKEDFCKAFITR